VIKRIASDPLPDLGAKNVPAPVVDAISKGMAKDPEERLQTAQDLGRSLQQAQVALGLPMTEMTMLGTPMARTAPVRRAAPVAAAPPPTSTAPPVAVASGPAGAPPPANRTPLVAAAIALVVVIAAIAFFATRGGSDSASSSSSATTTTRRVTTTTEPATTSTTPATLGDSTELLTNDGGQLEVNVPTSWSDHDTSATSDGSPELQASTDLSEFLSTSFLDPGVDIAVFAAGTIDPNDLDAGLDRIMGIDRDGSTLDQLCTRGTRQDFTPEGTGLSTARLEVLTACNGGGDAIIVAATNIDLTFTLLMEVHTGDPADDAGVDAVMTSFGVVRFP
jgi:hypothetical protein